MWDENKIRDYMLEVANKMTARDRDIVLKDVETLPIKIDGRLTKNMAYVSMSIDIETKEVINAVQFKFSKRLFYYNDDEIKHVIEHELMHLLVNLKYKKIWNIIKYGKFIVINMVFQIISILKMILILKRMLIDIMYIVSYVANI